MTAIKYGDMGRDQDGYLVWRDTADTRLTECCRSTVKGTTRRGHRITVCRACGAETDPAIDGPPQPPYTRNGRVTATVVKGWAQYATT